MVCLPLLFSRIAIAIAVNLPYLCGDIRDYDVDY